MKKFTWILTIVTAFLIGSFSYAAEGPKGIPVPSTKKKEMTKRSIQVSPKLRTLPKGEAGWADNYLPEYTRNVIDPQDGLRAGDGRVAVMNGPDASVIYEFASREEAYNGPGPDLSIYTSEGRYSGPYDVYIANYGEADWILIGRGVTGTRSLDFPPNVRYAQLVLLINQQIGETELDGVQALYPGEGGGSGGGGGGGSFDYYPDELVGLKSDRIDSNEVTAARSILRGRGNGYRMAPGGEVEVSWNRPANNAYRDDDLMVDADGSYQIWVTDTRGRESYLAQGSNTQRFSLPNDISGIIKLRLKGDNRRSITLYSIAGRR